MTPLLAEASTSNISLHYLTPFLNGEGMKTNGTRRSIHISTRAGEAKRMRAQGRVKPRPQAMQCLQRMVPSHLLVFGRHMIE